MYINKNGFTLVELAIVLVIIGLLVGGVFQGQELIKQANIRKAISDLNSYKTSVATFKAKYNQLPGDFSLSTSFFPSFVIGDIAANGNNDGIIDYHEGINFFSHLALAGLAKGRFLTGYPVNTSWFTILANLNYLPQNYLPTIYKNYLVIAGYAGFLYFAENADSDGYPFSQAVNWGKNPWFQVAKQFYNDGYSNEIDCEFLLSIDEKVDDGKPHTGSIMSTSNEGNRIIGFNAYHNACSLDGSNPNTNNSYVLRNAGSEFYFFYYFER
jgi:prepilin-type N-terminal cleavage/methylation domain-containing protein